MSDLTFLVHLDLGTLVRVVTGGVNSILNN